MSIYRYIYTHILYIFTNNGILLIIIDNLAVKLNKYNLKTCIDYIEEVLVIEVLLYDMYR